jgi:hypothetical protein
VIAVEVAGHGDGGSGRARTSSRKLCYLKRGPERGVLRVERRRRNKQAQQPW